MFGKQKNASSQAFQEAYGKLWQSGPIVKYQNPDGQVRDLATLSFC
jgi:hypothetical protein